MSGVIELGTVRLSHPESVREARNKIRVLALELSDDAVLSTRVATAVSEMSRLLVHEGREPIIEVGIRLSDGSSYLEIAFADSEPVSRPDYLATFFDRLESGTSSAAEYAVRASCRIGEATALDEQFVYGLRRVLEQQSRDELMAELQVKNQELVESFENLRRTTSAKERMESELNIGRDIQMSMLPLEFPAFPHRAEFDVHATLVPAREVGGDFYDFFLIDEDRLCLCIGDVSGKGVPAALFMAVTKTLIKSRASNDLSPASILTHVNNEISHQNEASMFVTIFLGILDLRSGSLRYTNAGHNPPYLKARDGDVLRLDRRHGPVIGAVEDLVYGEDEVSLSPGDMLLLYTDGVTEAMNVSGELYEEQKLVSVLSRELATVEAMVGETVDDVWHFQGEAQQADDVTVLAARYAGTGAGEEIHGFELLLENRLEEIDKANREFNAFAEEHSLSPAVRRQMNLVLDELLNNTISYAFEDEDTHQIKVEIELKFGRLVMTIVDDGIPFNPFVGPEPDTSLSVSERDIGGLGVHLVRNVMDEVSYNRRTDTNVVILVKHLDDLSDD
jgi:sigma-B regulation protein RsbU (phosphoserine phosphatase)